MSDKPLLNNLAANNISCTRIASRTHLQKSPQQVLQMVYNFLAE
jgi:hypothetical protein